MDPRIRIRIRIHTKMSRIRNTVKNHIFPADAPDNFQRLKRRTNGIVLGLDSTSAVQRNPGNFWQSGVWESDCVKKCSYMHLCHILVLKELGFTRNKLRRSVNKLVFALLKRYTNGMVFQLWAWCLKKKSHYEFFACLYKIILKFFLWTLFNSTRTLKLCSESRLRQKHFCGFFPAAKMNVDQEKKF